MKRALEIRGAHLCPFGRLFIPLSEFAKMDLWIFWKIVDVEEVVQHPANGRLSVRESVIRLIGRQLLADTPPRFINFVWIGMLRMSLLDGGGNTFSRIYPSISKRIPFGSLAQ